MKLGRLVAITVILCAFNAQAAVQRTFVSAATGNDANSCSRLSPCRNFAAAIAQTLPNGEVIVLDSGGYGPVTVMQAVTLEAEGVIAGISIFSGQDGVTVNASPSDKVVVRGLTINGLGGSSGVVFNTGGSLSLENLFVMHGQGYAVSSAGSGSMFIKDSTFIGNSGGGVLVGIPSSGVTKAVVEHCRVQGVGGQGAGDTGVYLLSNTRVTVRDSVIAELANGVFAYNPTAGADARGMVENCLISANVIGLAGAISMTSALQPHMEAVGPPPTLGFIRVSNSTIVHNQVGVSGFVYTRTNNTLQDNDVDGAFAGSYPAQ